VTVTAADSGRVFGVDIGGSGIKGAPVDLVTGTLAAERVRLATPAKSTPEAVAGVVAAVLDKLRAGERSSRAGRVASPIGVTVPAVVRGGVVMTAANIASAWIGADATALFDQALGQPVVVLNDADAAGLAEVRYGAGRDRAGVVLMITLGTGIGSALFMDGALVPNTELGHLPLHHGDAEDWAAASVREQDALSWKEWGHRLQRYLELVQRLLWPDLIIIGGGVSRRADKFLRYLDLRTEVVPAQLHNDAGIVGAALAAARAVRTAGRQAGPR